MDNQLIQSPIEIKKISIAFIALGIIAVIGFLGVYWHNYSDPYVKDVLSLEGNSNNGRGIFQINCSGCHASQMGDSVGPNLLNVGKRKSKAQIIKQVVSGKTPPMPKFQPTPQEMADLLRYLEEFSA